jgi:SP family galactose:H+ symporter-like MFS transporter
MFAGSFILPESPRWLMLKGRREKAVAVLRRTLNSEEDIEKEINEIASALESGARTGRASVMHGYFLKILLVGVLLQMFQQLVGINMMIYYSATIFGYAGMAGLTALLTVPTVNMLFTFPAIHLVEKWGRKKLLYVGAAIMFITMLMAGIAFQSIGDAADPALIADWPKTLLLVAAIVYIFGFAVSWGPVAWLVCSEIFPLEGREIGMTVTTMVNWTFAGLVMNYALSFMAKFGNASIFYLFAGFCVLAILFVSRFVPETRGVTLEKIESNLKSGVSLRHLGRR